MHTNRPASATVRTSRSAAARLARRLAAGLVGVAALSGCVASNCHRPMPVNDTGSVASAAPVRGKVTDLEAFRRFIGTQPTPEQFHARYPDVLLVLPGQPATKELRMDNSRYFAQVAGGRITGGQFQ